MNMENMKETLVNKRSGFYVGAAGALLALVALFLYLNMNSAYFTGLIIAGLVLGIVVFAIAALSRMRILYVLSYAGYMFAFYHFLTLEIELRMDTIVDPMQGFWGLDGIFYVTCLAFLACILVTIVASCMKQETDDCE